jgi:putative protein kinase ArgK-like GTPase of G3E family
MKELKGEASSARKLRPLLSLIHPQERGEGTMSLAKVYALDVEAGVEHLVTQMAELREQARSTLEKARTEHEQMQVWQNATAGRKRKKGEKNVRKRWDQVEIKLEEAFEDLEEALLRIREPFRK